MQNWMVLAGVLLGSALALFFWNVWKRRWTAAALAVGTLNLAIAAMNVAAPVRGLLDPAYRGYRFGLLAADRGPLVTLAAGLVLVGAAASAAIAVANRRGAPMLWVAFVDAALLANLAAGFAAAAREGSGFEIQFGEYLRIPSGPGLVLMIVVFLVPLALAALWALRRAAVPRAA
jgi:hypothetical protein